MADFQLAVEERKETGKGANRRLRRAGYIPGVVYGPGKDSMPLKVEERTLQKLLREVGTSHLIDLKIGDETKTVLVKEVQHDPVRGQLLHVDFHEVPLDREITATVPVVLAGEDQRVSDGGVISHSLRELEVACLPTNIPEHFEVDISGLSIGDSILVRDIKPPEGIRLLTDPEETVVSVVAPTREPEAVEQAVAEEGGVVPEVGEEAKEAGE